MGDPTAAINLQGTVCSRDAPGPGGQKKHIRTDWLHQDAIVNVMIRRRRPRSDLRWRSRSLTEERNGKGAVTLPRQRVGCPGIGPVLPVEILKANSAPVKGILTASVAFDLDMHHHGVRLLDLSNLSQLHAIAETRGEIGPKRVRLKISCRHARQQKEHCSSAQQYHEHQCRGGTSE